MVIPSLTMTFDFAGCLRLVVSDLNPLCRLVTKQELSPDHVLQRHVALEQTSSVAPRISVSIEGRGTTKTQFAADSPAQKRLFSWKLAFQPHYCT